MYAMLKSYNSGMSKEKNASLLGLVRLFLGEVVTIYSCKLNDNAFKKLIDEVQAKLQTVFHELVSSKLKRTSVKPMIQIDHLNGLHMENCLMQK